MGEHAYEPELRVAIEAARRAGSIGRQLFRRLERVSPKGKRDIVTEADLRSEAAILESIRSRFPGDAIVAEESGGHGITVVAAMGGPTGPASGRTWFVDPLDGTVNYANGIPFFCVAIGFAVDGRPVLGVLYDPERDELLSGVRGRGAQRDGQPMGVVSERPLEECLVAVVHSRGFLRLVTRVRPHVRAVRDLGSAALSIAYVGGSRLDGYVQPRGLSPWDLCAAGVIAEEGGATVTAIDGGPWFQYPSRSSRASAGPPSLSILAAAPRIHPQLLALLRRDAPRDR